MQTISIIGTVGVPAKYGGFETLTEHLTENLYKKYNITVYCSSKSYNKKLDYYNGAELKYINLNANGIQSVPYDILSILKSLKFADTILILGVSGCIILPFIKLFSKTRVIVNIDGMEWKRDKWKWYAKFFLKFSERMAVHYSDVVIVDNQVIQEYVKVEYGIKSKLIAYGADHVKRISLENQIIDKYSFLKNKYAFSVCRIEPENNIHIILKSFKEYKKLNLVIIGNWSNSEYGIELKKKYSIYKNIFLLNPIYKQEILNQMRSNCYIYIHGHSAGGTNPSLVEAMYLKLPIFVYNVGYNKETTKNRALYFSNIKELIILLKNINKTELETVANNMERLAKNNYTWRQISRQYSDLFNPDRENSGSGLGFAL